MTKIDNEETPKEAGHALIGLVASAKVGGLHDSHQWGQAEREWNEDEVIEGGRAELPPGQSKSVQWFSAPPAELPATSHVMES
jgi:hypothetical protein